MSLDLSRTSIFLDAEGNAGPARGLKETYGAATSRAYDIGKRRMLAEGHDLDVACAFGKKQYALASELWKLARE